MGTADTGMGSSPALDQGSHQAIILVGEIGRAHV